MLITKNNREEDEIVSNNDDIALNLSDAAKILGITRAALEKRCDRNTIEYFLDDRGIRRVSMEEIDRIRGSNTISSLSYNPYDYDPVFDIPRSEIWGNGLAPVIELPDKKWVTVLGVNDIHVPYHNMILIDAVIEIAAEMQPDLFIINGDTNDFFNISRFNKALERMDLLQAELDMGKMVRRAFRNAMPNTQFHETLGNHEERLFTYPAFNAPALRSLDALKPAKLMGLDELEITHWPINGFRLQEDFLVEHGTVIRTSSGFAAKARLEQTLISGVQGHTHRADSASRTGYRDLQWFETGCLCMLNPDYVRNEANWKNAFWIGHFSTVTGNFNIQLIKATGNGFIFDGKHYGDTESEADIWSSPTPVTA